VNRVWLEVESERSALRGTLDIVAPAARETREYRKKGKESAHGGEQ
jgi:hypothetical protein